jgi:hypothetical protein
LEAAFQKAFFVVRGNIKAGENMGKIQKSAKLSAFEKEILSAHTNGHLKRLPGEKEKLAAAAKMTTGKAPKK